MILSKGRGYVFVHIPKTGGTAMALALEARAMKDDIMIGDTPKARKRRRRLDAAKTAGRLWKHATLADIDGLVSVAELAPLFAFTLVRNPWDRMVSYYHWLRAQNFDHPAVHLAQEVDFTGFLRAQETQASVRANGYARYMTRADGVEHCAAYVRLEHLEQDLAPVEKHLGFSLDLPHVNRSDRAAGYRDYYTGVTRAIVADICAEDIARFGYRFV